MSNLVNIEPVDIDQEKNEALAQLKALNPTLAGAIKTGDPTDDQLTVSATLKARLMQYVNLNLNALMLKNMKGQDLDDFAQTHYGVILKRLEIEAANPNANPPTDAVLETDDDYRRRIELAPEIFSTAGSVGSYQLLTMSESRLPVRIELTHDTPGKITFTYHYNTDDSHFNIKDVAVLSPTPSHVTVYLLSRAGDGTASTEQIQSTQTSLDSHTVTPITDRVTVQSADIVNYSVEGTRSYLANVDQAAVAAASLKAGQAFIDEQHKLNKTIRLNKLRGAFCVPGIDDITLTQPTGDIVCTETQAPYCTLINLVNAS